MAKTLDVPLTEEKARLAEAVGLHATARYLYRRLFQQLPKGDPARERYRERMDANRSSRTPSRKRRT